MTLSIKETGAIHKCSGCKVKTVATSHNGQIVARAGKQVVFGPSLSVSCAGCGHVNHISVHAKANIVD